MSTFIPNKQIHFLFSFEENCCWIIPITSRSLWWICSIARYVWTMVSMLQKWWFRCCNQRTWKIAKTVRTFGNCWTKIIHKHKNNSQSNFELVNELFPIAYEKWERFRKPVHRYHMSLTTCRWNVSEILLARYKRKVFLHRIVTGDVSWESQDKKVIGRHSL